MHSEILHYIGNTRYSSSIYESCLFFFWPEEYFVAATHEPLEQLSPLFKQMPDVTSLGLIK